MSGGKTLVVIPARLASTRLPNKPLADIAGKPMILHVWERAVASKVGEVLVACDSQQVADVITRAGGKAILTNPDHPSGSDRIWEAVIKFDAAENYSLIINVQGDLPTLEPALITKVALLLSDKAVDIGTLACVIKEDAEKNDPAVVKPVIALEEGGQKGKALYFTRATAPYGEGKLYHHIGIYAYRRESLKKFVSLPPSPLELREKLEQLRALEAGMRIEVAIVDTVPLGVDTQEHLEIARRRLA